MNTRIIELEKKINVKFKDKKILIKSLTHKSFDKNYNNEKLEFLGDRVLGLIISKNLLQLYPSDTEGTLDKKFANLVNKKKCFEIALEINLDKFINFGNQIKNRSKLEPKILADCCEAIVGAIFLDKGIIEVENFILRYWDKHLKKSQQTIIDSKTKLQEYSLKKFKKLPVYKLIKFTGPKHKPLFIVGVKLSGSKFYEAKGHSKKDAEQKAATLLLESL
tara:strand:- start:247 stop:906 length:660 start_codon:yes stop_codon:yes gene_type:complete